MNFSTSKEKILNAITMAERVVGKKETLPVLSCILLDIGEECVLAATNLEAAIEVRIPGDIKSKGTLAVPVSVFSQTLRAVSGDTVRFKEEGGNLLVESKGSKTLIKTVPHDEFPRLSATEKARTSLIIARNLLITGLHSVVYAASPSMIRPELGSVYVRFEEGTATCVATDSFRLAEKVIPKLAREGTSDLLIPLKHVTELVHIIERVGDEELTVSIDDSQLTVRADGVCFVSRIVDATFPNYKEIIPKQFTTEATLLKSDFIETLRKARIFSGTEQRVGLHVYPKKKVLDITAQSAAIGEMSDSVEAALSGDDIDINFHVGYLSDALSSIESDSIVLGLSGPGRPLVMRGTSDSTFTYLVMPLNR